MVMLAHMHITMPIGRRNGEMNASDKPNDMNMKEGSKPNRYSPALRTVV